MRNCPHFIGFPIPEIPQSCRNPLGMESGQIPNSAITASSQLTPAYGPENARLHFKGAPGRVGAWIPLSNDHGQWLQVDFGRETQVTGIATQGYYHAAHWVTSYSLQYSNDGSYFNQYQPKTHTKVHFSLLVTIFSFTNRFSCIKNDEDWLAQLVERRTAVREVSGSSPRPDQHSGS